MTGPTLVEDPGHAIRSASSAERWMACTGSPELIGSLAPGRSSSEYAAEGTVAHQVGAEALLAGDKAKDYIGREYEADGFKFVVDEEMAAAVQTYLNNCRFLIRMAAEQGAWWVEVDLTPALREVHPDFGGHADFILYNAATRALYVVDYKHGAGVLVEVENNKQLMYYAIGALLRLGKPVEKVVSMVVQPRCMPGQVSPVRRHSYRPVDLFDLLADLLAAANAERTLVAGDHCRWCPAAAHCPELRRATDLVMADEFDIVGGDSVHITMEQLAEALALAPAVEGRISALRQLGYDLAMRGSPPPGFKLVAKRAMSSWSDEGEARKLLAKLVGAKAYAPRKVITPAQALKVVGSEHKDTVSALITKSSRGYNLVPESDRRKAAELSVIDDFESTTGS